jgi:hypothetical protein
MSRGKFSRLKRAKLVSLHYKPVTDAIAGKFSRTKRTLDANEPCCQKNSGATGSGPIGTIRPIVGPANPSRGTGERGLPRDLHGPLMAPGPLGSPPGFRLRNRERHPTTRYRARDFDCSFPTRITAAARICPAAASRSAARNSNISGAAGARAPCCGLPRRTRQRDGPRRQAALVARLPATKVGGKPCRSASVIGSR